MFTKKEKKAKEDKKEEKEFVPEMMPEEKNLTTYELHKLNNSFHDQAKAQTEDKLHRKDIIILQLKREVLKLQSNMLENEIKKCEDKVKKEHDKLQVLKSAHRDFSKSISAKYELDEKWGFDPETGKLI